MEIKDIIALANAGFTAVQIAAMANAQQMQAQQMPQMQVQQMPQMQVQQMPQMQVQQMPQMSQMQAQQMPQMQAQQMPQVQAQQMPQMPAVDPVLEQLKQLTGIVQNGNIMAASQPAVRNSDDIIGTIINPPATDKG